MRYYAIILGIITLAFVSAALPAHTASAFNAGRIIDDGVFTNKSSMSPSSVQSFLNSKVPACDTWGAQTSEFGGGTRRQWAEARGYSAPFTCLRDYSEGGRTAAQIIYDAAQEFAINPQVLIVLLQKEQGLVTDTWPLASQYKTATGYGCPDTAACDSQYFGLTNQIRWAGRMFRAIINNSPTWYTPYVLGNNYIQYNPVASCGGSNVNIQNRSTQALYNYTPYQPNAAALAAGWGTASCGAYGNRNFYLYFTNWFGSTTAAASYGYSIVSREFYSDSAYQNRLSDTPTIEPSSTFYVRITVKNTGNQTWYKDSLRLGGQDPVNRSSDFATNSWMSPGRVGSMNENSVAGGENATFTFSMRATPHLETRYESFGVLIEGQRWLDGFFTLPITIASANPYYSVKTLSLAAYSDSNLTRPLNAASIDLYTGSKMYVKATLKNTGNQPLPATITKLATSNPRDRTTIYSDASWISQSRVTLAQEGIIAPGATGTFRFSMTAPDTAQARKIEQFGLVIEGERWIHDDIGAVSVQTYTRPPSELSANQTLGVNQSLLSYDERFRLTLQNDGNLVLYSPTRAIWSSSTVGKGGIRLVMQDDGNLVLYRSDWAPVWNSRTGGRGNSKLIPQVDGNLVLYTSDWKPTWYTSTGGQ